MSSDTSTSRRNSDAQAYVQAWRRAETLLENKRLCALRQLSEEEAAQRFARLLCTSESYPLRNGSGLVEQQRIFSRLRDQEL